LDTIREVGCLFQRFGKGEIAILDPRDVGDVAAKILSAEDISAYQNKAFSLTGPSAISCQRAAEIFATVLHREVKYVDLTEEQALQGMLATGTSEILAKGLITLSNLARAGVLAQSTTTVPDLLYRKAYPLEQSLRHAIQTEQDIVIRRIGIIGSGDVARNLGAALAKHGISIVIGSRDPNKKPELQEWVKKTGQRITTSDKAATFGEVVILATDWSGTENAIKLAGPEHFAGKIVLDLTNPLDHTAKPPKLSVSGNSSAGELIQKWLPNSHVVKVWNIVASTTMVDPDINGQKPDMWICGNDAKSKKIVTDLLHRVGWETVYDLGSITSSRYLEALAMVFIQTCFQTNYWTGGFKMLKK